MTSDWQVVLPHIGPRENLEQCLAKVGKVDVPFLIVDNSPTGDCASMEIPSGIEVEAHPDNLGIAASWNLGLAHEAAYTLVLSASIRFGFGGLERTLYYMDQKTNRWGLQLGSYPMREDGLWNVGWRCIAFGRDLVDLVGDFDENFWPGYFEDLDYSYRTFLAFGGKDRKFPLAQGDVDMAGVSMAGAAIAVKAGFGFPPGVRQSGDPVRDRYREKWGGHTGEETFMRPFNDSTKNWKYWESPPKRIYPGPGE